MMRRYPSRTYGYDSSRVRQAARRYDRSERIREAQAIAQHTSRIYKSFTYYGSPSYNFLRIPASATYNVQFVHFNTDEIVNQSLCEAFAQIILTPGRADKFITGAMSAFDMFKVRYIEWNYTPPTTESIDELNAQDQLVQPPFPFTNCVMRYIYDPTANVSTLNDVRLDMKRYLPTAVSQNNPQFISRVVNLAANAMRKNQYETRSSMEEHRGIIRKPMATLFNENSILGSRRNERIETTNAWHMTRVVTTELNDGVIASDEGDQGAGTVAATYGTLTLAIPAFANGLLNRNQYAWPKFLAFVNVTYYIDCYGQN